MLRAAGIRNARAINVGTHQFHLPAAQRADRCSTLVRVAFRTRSRDRAILTGGLTVSASDSDRQRPAACADRQQRDHYERENPPTGKTSRLQRGRARCGRDDYEAQQWLPTEHNPTRRPQRPSHGFNVYAMHMRRA